MGKIYQRGNTWYSNYSFQGKRVRRPLSPNRRQAQAMQDELMMTHRAQRYGLVPEQLRWEYFKNQYLAIRKEERKPITFVHDRLAMKRLDEVFAITYLSEVTPELLEQAKLKWKERGYSECAVGAYVIRIKVAMRMAEAWRYVSVQPWRIVKNFVSSGRVIYYTMDQFKKCLKKTDGPWKTALLLMTFAGLRSGEVRNLEWSDIDFGKKIIRIQPKSWWKPKGWTFRRPASREVDIPNDLQNYLEALPHKQGRVLGAQNISEAKFSSYFRNLVNEAGLRGSAHAFRHTYASWLISNGCSLEEVGSLLGHTNPMTTQMYAHLMPHARRRAIERLPSFVPGL